MLTNNNCTNFFCDLIENKVLPTTSCRVVLKILCHKPWKLQLFGWVSKISSCPTFGLSFLSYSNYWKNFIYFNQFCLGTKMACVREKITLNFFLYALKMSLKDWDSTCVTHFNYIGFIYNVRKRWFFLTLHLYLFLRTCYIMLLRLLQNSSINVQFFYQRSE